MGAKGIVFKRTAPVVVDDLAATLLRAYALHPVVLVCKAASGPAEHGDAEGLQGLQDVRAIAVHIGDGGVRSHPDTLVDASAQVLGELSEQLCRDDGLAGGALMNGNFYLCCRAEAKGCGGYCCKYLFHCK